jgi:signal transduction histidine kinase
LNPDRQVNLQPAIELGQLAVAAGLKTLELARIHEHALTTLGISKSKSGIIKQAEIFFAKAITPLIETHHSTLESKFELKWLNETPNRRTAELAAANLLLRRGIARHTGIEIALKKSGEYIARRLKESLQLQDGLRQLTHQALAAQEHERKKISRELQNEIAQTLLGVNIRLLSLKQDARNNAKDLKNEIASTQRLVIKSAKSVRQVARRFSSL